MRSIKTTVTAAAILTAGFAMTAPAAHAATTPQDRSAACTAAVDTAKTANSAFNTALAALKKQMENGGHPGKAEQDNVVNLMNQAKAAIANAQKMCAGEMEHGMRHGRHHHPHGAMRTGVGSTSEGANGGEIAGGLGVLGAVGAGALALRRRRAGSKA